MDTYLTDSRVSIPISLSEEAAASILLMLFNTEVLDLRNESFACNSNLEP